MVYDSLLLNFGGGIISDTSKSKQYEGSAALAIGLGGTGVAALSVLKGKIYQQLIPDNPGDPLVKYDGIQLLAIDSDEGDFQKYRGNCRLRKDEFLSICNPNLSTALKNKDIIYKNARLNWMEIDRIDKMLSPQGAGGIRQVGRYLLMSKVDELEKVIQSKCRTALKQRGARSLDIYIFAGISGGTGSGCFLDMCYLVRKIVENNGWEAKIMGYFFLPDVVTSKQEVANDNAAREYNESNGYAAMKELDYLMSLKDANDWFTQDYNASLKVHTQDPPVDMCHLVSACKADGTLVPNGFTYGINVASDYVMSYLADVQMDGGGDGTENGLTMRGHLANVGRGVDQLSREYGANLSYHVMGACNAEIPMNQINTYLACGFYAKFMQAISGERITVTKSAIAQFVKDCKLSADDIVRNIAEKSPPLEVPDIDFKFLANQAMPAAGTLPSDWARTCNDWYDRCGGVMTNNGNGLLMPLDGFDYTKANPAGLMGRVFRKLWELSVDPNCGPYFAAQILHNGSEDLTTAIDGAIKTADGRVESQELYYGTAKKRLEEVKAEFHRKPNKRSYADYRAAAGQYYFTMNAIEQQKKTAEVLRKFKKMVVDLYETYYKPLTEMLDNLRETFQENRTYLSLPEATESNAYTMQILTFNDIKKTLDERIEALSTKELVNDFVGKLLANSDAWIDRDSDKIAMQIRLQMLELFHKEASRSLQDYLMDKYPQASDVKQLAEYIENDIMNSIHHAAVPMYWRDPGFDLENNTFQSSSLSVPAMASAVCTAAEDFKEHNSASKYTIRMTGIGDRIFALRLCSGVPLYAYQGITLLKSSYDKAAQGNAGVGSHLYAATGRGAYGSGHKDWRNFLPTPMPFSRKPDMIPEGAELMELYKKGEEAGIIAVDPTGAYVINMSKAYEPKVYELADFVVDGRFSIPSYDAEYKRLTDLAENLYVKCEQFPLKNDGDPARNGEGMDVVARCRMDYFLHYPLLQKAVREELQKQASIAASLESLKAVKAAYDSYESDMDRYCTMIFYKNLNCENSMEQEDYDKIAFIYTHYVDKNQDTVRADLSNRSMTYGKEYPLYQGFLSYRALDPKKSPRKELDEAAALSESRAKKIEDLCIPYDLEQIWTKDRMDELEKEVETRNAQEAVQIVRFYEGLRERIRGLKDDSPIWLNPEKREALRNGGATTTTTTTATAAPVDPNAYWHVWDPTTGKTLVVYAQYGPANAYDQATQTWTAVRSDMKVWDGAAWADLKTNSFFANI